MYIAGEKSAVEMARHTIINFSAFTHQCTHGCSPFVLAFSGLCPFTMGLYTRSDHGQQTYGCGLMGHRHHHVILLNDQMHKRTNIVVAFLNQTILCNNASWSIAQAPLSHRLYYVIMPHGLLHKHL